MLSGLGFSHFKDFKGILGQNPENAIKGSQNPAWDGQWPIFQQPSEKWAVRLDWAHMVANGSQTLANQTPKP